MRKHLAERTAQLTQAAALAEFSERLRAHGVSDQPIEQAAAEMKIMQ